MKTTVLILAAGRMWRGWTKETPKQLAPIASEPVILRIIRQLKERGYDEDIIVVTHNKAIQAVVPRYFEPARFYWRTETLASTRELWGERTIVLHGDTIYSPTMMDTIVATHEPFMFIGIGDKMHVEACVFTDQDLVLRAANMATDAANVCEAGPKPENLAANQDTPKRWGGAYEAWTFYRALSGLPPVEKPEWAFNPKIHRIVKNDYTVDIDTPQVYKWFLSKHKWA